MQFLTNLFGGAENTLLTATLALGIVLVLIVLGVWTLKVFFRASSNLGRGRNRRLTIVDSVAIDPRRRLLIVRRDGVEHVILTGGPQDLVIETGIPVERTGNGTRRPAAAPAASEPAAEPQAAHEPASPSRPVTDAMAAAKALGSAAGRPERGAMARLRDLARPAGTVKTSPSLRHTGLLRPVSRMEPAAVIPIGADNSDHRRVDSAKTAPANDVTGRARFGAASYHADGAKAEGS